MGKSEATEKSKTQSVNLPKLEFMKFNGMVLKWPEFYDAFQAAVDSNPNLSGVDKFNYLHSRLEGDALEVIGGMTLTNAIYDKAKDILKGKVWQTRCNCECSLQESSEFTHVFLDYQCITSCI